MLTSFAGGKTMVYCVISAETDVFPLSMKVTK